MISPSLFRDLASGRSTGPGATMMRAALSAASVPYGWVVAARNRRYDRGAAEIYRSAAPVVSVGNLTVGGTGKTPMVEWIARRMREAGVRVTILSRGYKAQEGGQNDEALELELALPDVPHLQNPDRTAAARLAVDELAAQLLLLDDGFQHRRLARDLDVVLLDATAPFGFDRLLPRGALREPPASLRRAGVVVLSRADMIDAAARDAIRRRASALAPDAAWCEVAHRPAALVDSTGATHGLDELAGARVLGFCGVGNPRGFRHTLETLGCEIAAWIEFPDHHAYERGDVETLVGLVEKSGAAAAVCTRKDLVKLRTPRVGPAPLRAVAVELEFLDGELELRRALAPLVARACEVRLTGLD